MVDLRSETCFWPMLFLSLIIICNSSIDMCTQRSMFSLADLGDLYLRHAVLLTAHDNIPNMIVLCSKYTCVAHACDRYSKAKYDWNVVKLHAEVQNLVFNRFTSELLRGTGQTVVI